MIAECITQHDRQYQEASSLTRRIYQAEISVAPTSDPPLYLTLQDNRRIIGSLGLWPGDKKNPFLVERYCQSQGIDPTKSVPGLKGRLRVELAEIGNLNMLKYYRKRYLPSLFFLTTCFCLSRNISFLYLIYGTHVARSLRMLDVELLDLCSPDLRDYDGTEEEKQKWNRVYFSKLKPRCAVINAEQAYQACRSRHSPSLIQLGSSLNNLQTLTAPPLTLKFAATG